MLRLNASGFTHVGMRRAQNQDSFLIASDLRLFIVADGMGGHQGGETASAMATENIRKYMEENASPEILHSTRHKGLVIDPVIQLQKAILSANQAIQARGQDETALQGMGTTATALYFTDAELYIAHVGDSRGYLLHPQRIWQITRDHSLVQEKLRAGLITRAQLKTDRMKNVITRSVGFESEVDVDVYKLDHNPGDTFLLCSDGLSGMLEDTDILQIVDEYVFKRNTIEMAAEKLIEAANRAGGDDNVTAVLVQVS
ncbi:MAG: Stp1/IreP family PP2C-type Ser/Thr phosphatase [Bdellovibrionota bacterium]